MNQTKVRRSTGESFVPSGAKGQCVSDVLPAEGLERRWNGVRLNGCGWRCADASIAHDIFAKEIKAEPRDTAVSHGPYICLVGPRFSYLPAS